MPQQNLVLDPPAPAPMSGPLEVALQGGPDDIPRTMVVTNDELAYGKIKVPHLDGYEHFERESDYGSALLFRWTTRTKIAE